MVSTRAFKQNPLVKCFTARECVCSYIILYSMVIRESSNIDDNQVTIVINYNKINRRCTYIISSTYYYVLHL